MYLRGVTHTFYILFLGDELYVPHACSAANSSWGERPATGGAVPSRGLVLMELNMELIFFGMVSREKK